MMIREKPEEKVKYKKRNNNDNNHVIQKSIKNIPFVSIVIKQSSSTKSALVIIFTKYIFIFMFFLLTLF